ncbi:hypothetical protein D3C86_1699630 [compost metagenome]
MFFDGVVAVNISMVECINAQIEAEVDRFFNLRGGNGTFVGPSPETINCFRDLRAGIAEAYFFHRW